MGGLSSPPTARLRRARVSNGGVGYGKVSPDAPDRAALIAKLDDASDEIASGDVDIPRR